MHIWKKNIIYIICWALFQLEKVSLYVLVGCLHSLSCSKSPPHPSGQGWGVRGQSWVAACLSWRRGAGGEGPLTQRLSWVWEERSLLPLLLPPAHLAAPRTLIWRENKNVFISQEKRRTLEWKPQKLKHRESYRALTQAYFAGMVTSFSALSNSFKLSAALLLVSLFFRFSPIIHPCIFTITHLNQGPDPSPKSSYTYMLCRKHDNC